MDANDWELFKLMAIDAAGLTNNPKANELYALAWENGHEGGKEEVLNHLCDLAEMETGSETSKLE